MTDDEALETLFAMANVQDGYAKKATDPGLKVIHKANAKAQREIAATIKDLRVRLAAAEADRDRLAAANAALEAQVARLEQWQVLSEYVLQDEFHNRLIPRVVDIAYSAFMNAKRPNNEDGGPTDWFTDTRPMVMQKLAEIRAALAEVQADARREGGE